MSRNVKSSLDAHVVSWDDLILLAEEQIDRLTRKLTQAEALLRVLRAQQARGDECPIMSALESTQLHVARIKAELDLEERAARAADQARQRVLGEAS